MLFWEGEMKYAMTAWVALFLLMIALFYFVSPFVAAITVVVGGLGIMYGTHSYWSYERMRDDPEFEYNPVAGALVGTALMYIVCFVIVIVTFAFWGVMSSMTGWPLVIPGAFLTWLLYAAYVLWW